MTDSTPVEVTQADIDAAETAWENAALADIYCDPRNIGPEFGDGPHDPVGVLAVAFARHRQQAIRSNASSSEAVAQHEGELAAYKYSHETAVDLGYPSLTEALEHLSELKDAAQNEGEKETHPKLHKALRDGAKMLQQAGWPAQREGGRGEPVAFLYEKCDGETFVKQSRANMDKTFWTEAPLYAHPPATRPTALAEDEVEANSPPVDPGDRWIERWCGSGMWKGSSIWTADSIGCHKNLVEHVGGNEETHAMVRLIVAAHNAALSPRIAQQAEEVARLREDTFAAGFYAAEKALGYEANDESDEALAIEWVEYLAALNEQPGGEETQ